jgi:hypothetical protein
MEMSPRQPDRSGRVNAAPLLAVLGWQAGERIDVNMVHGTVVITALRTGRHQIGAHGDVAARERGALTAPTGIAWPRCGEAVRQARDNSRLRSTPSDFRVAFLFYGVGRIASEWVP